MEGDLLKNYECRDCQMKFETQQQLSNHVTNFCVNSNYGNPNNLEVRWNELGKKREDADANLNVNDVKRYLKGEEVGHGEKQMLGGMTLDNLRGYFEADENKFHAVQTEALRNRENEMRGQLDKLKDEKKKLRLQNTKNEDEYEELLREIETTKEKELRARIEKEQILATLKEVERNKLDSLYEFKQKEVSKLAQERETLKYKEQEMLNEIKQLKENIVNKEEMFEEEKTRVKEGMRGKESHLRFGLQRKELELAKEQGAQIGLVRKKREELENERKRIMKDLDMVQRGNLEGLSKNRWIGNEYMVHGREHSNYDQNKHLDPALKDKLIEDQSRLNILRKEHERTKRQMLPAATEIDIAQREAEIEGDYPSRMQRFVNQTEEESKGDPRRMANHMGTIRAHMEGENPSYVPEARPKSRTIPGKNTIASLGHHHQEPPPDSRDMMPVRQPHDRRGYDGDYHKPERHKEKYTARERRERERERDTYYDDHKPKQPQLPSGMMMGGGAYGMNPYMGYPPMMPPQQYPTQQQPPIIIGGQNPPPAAPQPDPAIQSTLMQLNHMIQKTKKQNKKLESEMKRLNEEKVMQETVPHSALHPASRLKSTNLPPGSAFLQRTPHHPLTPQSIATSAYSRSIQPEITLKELDDMKFKQNDERQKMLEMEEKALVNLTAAEVDDLKILNSLDPSSELYQFKLQQYKDVSSHRALVEKTLQTQRLEKIRRDFERQKKEGIYKFLEDEEVDKIVEEEKREHIKEQIREEFLEKNPEFEEGINRYDPKQGFNVYWDYSLYMPKEYQNIQIVYAIYNNGVEVTEPRMVMNTPAEEDDNFPDFNRVIFNVIHLVMNVGASPNVRMVIEVQTFHRQTGQTFNIGWTLVDLFDYVTRLKNGLYKVPLFHAPTYPKILDQDIGQLKKVSNMSMYFRISYPLNDYISSIEVSPTYHRSKYALPDLLNFLDAVKEEPARIPVRPKKQRTDEPTIAPRQQYLPPEPQWRGQGQPPPPPQNPPNQQPPPQAPPPAPHPQAPPPPEPARQPGVPARPDIATPVQQKIMRTEGINVTIEDMRNYMPKGDFMVGIGIYEGLNIYNQPDGLQAYSQTKMLHPANLITAMEKKGKTAISNGGQYDTLDIDFQDEWRGNIPKIRFQYASPPPFFVVFQLLEKVAKTTPTGGNTPLQTGMSISLEFRGYAVHNLTDQDGAVSFGVFELPFYSAKDFKLPVPPTAVPIGVSLTARIGDWQGIVKPITSMSRILSGSSVRTDINQTKEAFIANPETYGGCEYVDTDGIDIYVDELRFLPLSASVTRLNCRIYQKNLWKHGEPAGAMPIGDSKVNVQQYDLRWEIRGEINPTCVFFFTIETCDMVTMEPRILGYVGINLFNNKSDNSPVSDPKAPKTNVLLQNKGYQLPIMFEDPLKSTPLTMEKMLSFPNIPGASALVRIIKAPNKADGVPYSIGDLTDNRKIIELGIVQDAPSYDERTYNTRYYNPHPEEIELMYNNALRELPTCNQEAKRIADELKIEIPPEAQDDLVEWFDTAYLKVVARTPILELDYYYEYQDEKGLQIDIEGLINLPNNLIYIILLSTNPPANFYLNPSHPVDDVKLISNINFQSGIKNLKFNEGWLEWKYLRSGNEKARQFIADIKSVQITKGVPKIMDWGWTIIPAIDCTQTTPFVKNGHFVLPIFKAPVPNQVLLQLGESETGPLHAQEIMPKTSSIKLLAPCGLVVKIRSAQFTNLFKAKFDYENFDYSYILAKNRQKYNWDLKKEQTDTKAKKYATLVPKGKTPAQYQTEITQAVESLVQRSAAHA